jgi:N-acetylglucosamine kinase-like BadF-type ATPase
MDELFGQVEAAVREALSHGSARAELFAQVLRLAGAGLPAAEAIHEREAVTAAAESHHPWPVPYLSEPWYC